MYPFSNIKISKIMTQINTINIKIKLKSQHRPERNLV